MQDIMLNSFYSLYRTTIRRNYQQLFQKPVPIKTGDVAFTDYSKAGNHTIRSVKLSYIPFDEAVKLAEWLATSKDIRTKNSEAVAYFIKAVEEAKNAKVS